MDKYDIIEKLECAKINFNNVKTIPQLFDLAMEQLQEAIDGMDGLPEGS